MPGRIPKAKAQRARANKTMGAQLPKEGSGIEPPDYPGERVSDYGLDYWQTIWTSPMGSVYLDADIPALVRLTQLMDLWNLTRDMEVLTEIRNLEDRFGLSPLSRRRLEWEIVQAGGQPETHSVESDDERFLRVVS